MSFISLTLNNIPEATKKPKFYRGSYFKVIRARQEFIVLAKVNFHRVAWSQVRLQLHKFIFLGLLRTDQNSTFFSSLSWFLSPKTNCLNYQVLDHLLGVASLKIS